ncbi:enoyl-CoA hydratase/isomerase family protein [Marmoricola sp. RAF53]|uniref:enoyl-CoA hydratase/isomerase family protein n=1 Tax=Marmoricola sp. RAF53 TaxID=3233059 RepID=UPI003F9BC730
MTWSSLQVEERADRLLVQLNRPEAKNAIDRQMVEELHQVCAELEQTPRIALIIGAGGNFAAGADIAQLRDRRREDALAGINSGIFDRIRRLPMPVIGLLDGYVLGGGAELAYACDFRIGTPEVRIGNPEPGLGILAAAGASWRLAELVGEPIAKEILLAGRVLKADAAQQLHLLNDVVAPDALIDAGNALADRIAGQGALAIRLSKAVFHAPREAHPFIDDLAQAVLFETEEKHDRMTAFLERKNRSNP